jgi:hypothetical protein
MNSMGVVLALGLQALGLQALGLQAAAAQGLPPPAGASGGATPVLPASRVSAPSPYAPGCEAGSPAIIVNSEERAQAAADPRNPLHLVASWKQDAFPGGTSRGIGVGYSFNGGVGWRQAYPPYTRCAGAPPGSAGDFQRSMGGSVSVSTRGVVHLIVTGMNPSTPTQPSRTGVLVGRSTDGGRHWSAPTLLVSEPGEQGEITGDATITADPTRPGTVYAVWSRLNFQPGSLGMSLISRSTDDGRTWEPARTMFDPHAESYPYFNRLTVLPDGTLVAIFEFTAYHPLSHHTLESIRSTDQGLTWSAPVRIAHRLPVPPTGGEGRGVSSNGVPQLAVARNGTLFAVWQDGILPPGAPPGSGLEYAGIRFSRSTDGGATWSQPVQINRIPQVEAFAPAVQVRADGSMGVTYYDLRNNTPDPATLWTDVWLIRSSDGGMTWHESHVQGPMNALDAPVVQGARWFGELSQALLDVGPAFLAVFNTPAGGYGNAMDVHARLLLGRWPADKDLANTYRSHGVGAPP